MMTTTQSTVRVEVPTRMMAVRLSAATGPAGLTCESIATPLPQDGEVLVRVHAAAITRDELEWPIRRLPAIPSYEFSGIVAALGQGGADLTLGEAVYALSAFDRNGAAADYAVVSREFVAPKPKALDHIESAALPLAALTAWQGLFEHGHLAPGQRVLIHGATGGVGHLAVQLARQCGAYVIGTVSTAQIEAARQLGIDEIINHTTTRFEEVVNPVDLVFDTAGGDRLERSPAIVRPGGKLISVAAEPSQAHAVAYGIEALYFVVEPNGQQLAELTRRVDQGQLRPIVAGVFPLAQARQAFEASLSAHPAGKIVLHIADD